MSRHLVEPDDSNDQVIIVGSGLAGLSAAYTALQCGAFRVSLLDRADRLGGNSRKASSGINGANTRFQPTDHDNNFWEDTIRSAGGRLSGSDVDARVHRESLISVLTNGSSSAIEFLVDVGVDLSVVTQLGGHSHARTHRPAGSKPPGVAIVSALVDKLKNEFGPSRFQLHLGCQVTKLLAERIELNPDDTASAGFKVLGVEYKSNSDTLTLTGPVIFATGGFAGDTHGLLAQYRPDLAYLPSTNEQCPGMHGMLSDVGARLVDMESVQIHPTGFVDPANPQDPHKILAPEMLRGEGGILLRRGRRFVNELDTRERVSEAIMSEPPAEEGGVLRQWDVQLVLDPGAAEAAAEHVQFYEWKGLMKRMLFRDLDEVTQQSLREYASSARGGENPLGARALGHWMLGMGVGWDEAEVVVGRVTPVTHFTMGGVVIDEQARVLASDMGEKEKVIPGLWVAGEVTGGIHGDNRLGGSSLLECVVFGRIAGEQAARELHP